VLLLVLPPVIYIAAVAMDWREFRDNLRPISLLAVGSVLFTTAKTAAAAHALLAIPWPVGFVLGAIVSPPDTMAPTSIAHGLHIPRRILVILEGELNDADLANAARQIRELYRERQRRKYSHGR
jgi:monovalent cation/hydrogen antiporter